MGIDVLAHEGEFIHRLRSRLLRGAAQYGDRSFHLPLPASGEEILAELEDIAGWAFVAWVNVRERLSRVERAVSLLDLPEMPPFSDGVPQQSADPPVCDERGVVAPDVD